MRKILILSIAAIWGCVQAYAQNISEENVRKHIQELANDSMLGRGSAQIGEKKAAAYLIQQFEELGIEAKGTKGYLQPFALAAQGHHGQTHHLKGKIANNVVAWLDNGAKQTIVIGAHYDHLGIGHDGSSLDPKPQGKIHNGADDNASGTSGVLELARYFKQNGLRENHNFLFICFSGEELGLLGSKYFADNPTIPLEQIHCMLNMDMIGRLKDDENTLAIHGVGTSDQWGRILNTLEGKPLQFSRDSSGVGSSDYTSFYLKDIPVIGLFTGAHEDYHKPSDDIDKLNFPGEVKVLKLAVQILEEVDQLPAPMVFSKAAGSQNDTETTKLKVTMGIMPGYVYDGKGMKVDAVLENRPAEKSGMKDGDVILKMDKHEVEDIYGYMKALQNFEKGQTVPVVVKRGDKEVTLKVTF